MYTYEIIDSLGNIGIIKTDDLLHTIFSTRSDSCVNVVYTINDDESQTWKLPVQHIVNFRLLDYVEY